MVTFLGNFRKIGLLSNSFSGHTPTSLLLETALTFVKLG